MDRTESTAEIASGLVEQAEHLVRLEIELAKAELKDLAKTNAIAAGLFAGAGLFALLALLVALPVLLVVVIPNHWLAALLWVVLYLVAAVVMALVGKAKLRLEGPGRTIESIKETRDWAMQQVRSPRRVA